MTFLDGIPVTVLSSVTALFAAISPERLALVNHFFDHLLLSTSVVTMPKYSNYVRTQIELLHNQGLHPAGILKTLKGEGLVVSLSGIIRLIKKLCLTGSDANLPRLGRPRKLPVEARAFIDQQMGKNDEMTSAKIQKKMAKRGISVSSSTVWRSQKQEGWTLQRTAYCQLIRDTNKVKRLEFAKRVLESGDTFHNMIFSDECSISLQLYRRTCFRMADEPTKRKPKPKHLLKVHVCGGISRHGATKICIFDGIMDADLFCNVLETALVPFIRNKLPNHQFMQDDDPKHTSRRSQAFFEEESINWWCTPPERPDLNPREDL